MSSTPQDVYTHGHGEPVLRSHRWRTAANSAAHLLPRLEPFHRVLDLGCGPGTISADLAALVPDGFVIGVDRAPEIIETTTPSTNLSFEVGDVYDLAFDDASFDVVHAHQVLQHLPDPAAALSELRRVLVPGGILAVRDSDYSAFVWTPEEPMLEQWRETYLAVCRANGAEPNAGRHLGRWVRDAGFTDVEHTSSTWTYDGSDARWWGDLWSDRLLSTRFGEQVVDEGLASTSDVAAMAAAWRRWGASPDAVIFIVHGDVTAVNGGDPASVRR